MRHADELILGGGELVHDAATQLYLDEHLRECRACRDLQRKVARADVLIAAPRVATSVPPRRTLSPRAPLGRAGVALLGAVVIVVGIVVGTAVRSFRDADRTSQVAAPGAPRPSLPPDWQLFTLYDLLIPVPPGWEKTVDEIGRPITGGSPRIIYFDDTAKGRWPDARYVALYIWPSRSVDELVRTRFIEGNLSFVSEGTLAGERRIRETIGVSWWSDGRGGGSTRGRNLFVQVDPERVVMVSVGGPQVPGNETEPTPEMRSVQETVIRHVVALRDVDRAFTPEQVRMAVTPSVPLDTPPSVVIAGRAHVVWSVTGRSLSFLRTFAYDDRAARLRADNTAATHIPATFRGIGNHAVWATSPDANIRYRLITALDALLDAPPAPSGWGFVRVSPAPIASCPRTIAREPSGILTANGTVGILDDTYASASDLSSGYALVQKGAGPDTRIRVEFQQIGSSAPATTVWYEVGATPRRSAWGDVAFMLGTKPIGWGNSCWRLIVDGADSGLVVFVGP
jgi:hypothetical protein